MFISIVTIDPPGPLYLPMLIERNITFSVETGRFISLHVTFNDGNSERYGLVEGREFVAGIAIISASVKRLLVSVNTNITSVTGIRYEFETVADRVTEDEDMLSITIYGK